MTVAVHPSFEADYLAQTGKRKRRYQSPSAPTRNGDQMTSTTIDPNREPIPEWAAVKYALTQAEIATYKTKLEAVEAQIAERQEASDLHVQEGLRAERRDLQRENVGLRLGLPVALHLRIAGNTLEDMEADARELLADLRRR